MKRMKLAALALCTGLMLCACGNEANSVVSKDTANNSTESQETAGKDENKDAATEGKTEAETDTKSDTKNDAADEKTETEVKTDDNTDETNKDQTTGVSVRAIYDEIKSKVELESPMEPPAEFIGNIIYGFNVNELEEYVFSMPEIAESAELVFIAKTNGADQADTVKNSMEAYKTEQAEMMKDYIPAEYDIIAASQVVIKGDYVYLVISHNSDAIIEIIENNIQ